MVQPGPGGVLLFAENVRSRWRETERTESVRAALGWVLGESKENPVISRPAKGTSMPPTMSEIRRARGKARTAQRKARQAGTRATRVGPSAHADYYKGVSECLRWISAGGSQPRRP
jgi:hypothetical protein